MGKLGCCSVLEGVEGVIWEKVLCLVFYLIELTFGEAFMKRLVREMEWSKKFAGLMGWLYIVAALVLLINPTVAFNVRSTFRRPSIALHASSRREVIQRGSQLVSGGVVSAVLTGAAMDSSAADQEWKEYKVC